MLGCFFVFSHPAWSLFGITKTSAWLGWVVLTGERSIHQISGFAYLDYRATWCRINLLFLFLSHCFLIWLKIVVIYSLCGFVAHLLLSILMNSFHYIVLLFVRSPSLQADSISLLPAREINERKQTITRELQLSFAVKSVVRVSLFCSLDSSETSTKNNKGNLRKVLCLLVCTRFDSRAYAWKKIKVVTPALL